MAEFYWRTDLFKFQMFLPIPGVPLLREGYLLAFLTCTGLRFGPSPKTKSSETFADQAVIAIENTQLCEAEQQRTRELAESLEQQTATSDVLRIISSSPSELDPIFQAILANGARLCEANFGMRRSKFLPPSRAN